MKKMFAALVVCLVLVLAVGVACASVVAKGFCGKKATWELDDQGVLTIGGSGAMTDLDSATPVSLRSQKSLIKSVNVQSGITSLCSYAFKYCSNLTSITIPSSVTSVGYDCFMYCDNLTNIYVDSLEQWLQYNHKMSYLHPRNKNGKLYINNEEVKDISIP